MSADPLVLLSDLLASLDEGRAPGDDVRQWLASGLRSMLDGDRLEAALGLVRQGAPTVRKRLAQIRADTLMHCALRAVPMLGLDASVWDRCQRLAPLLSRYVQGAWRSDRHRADAPDGEPWRIFCWHSMQFCPDPPTTPEGLWALAKRHHDRQLQRYPHNLLAHLMSQPCHAPRNESPSSDPSGPR